MPSWSELGRKLFKEPRKEPYSLVRERFGELIRPHLEQATGAINNVAMIPVADERVLMAAKLFHRDIYWQNDGFNSLFFPERAWARERYGKADSHAADQIIHRDGRVMYRVRRREHTDSPDTTGINVYDIDLDQKGLPLTIHSWTNHAGGIETTTVQWEMAQWYAGKWFHFPNRSQEILTLFIDDLSFQG